MKLQLEGGQVERVREREEFAASECDSVSQLSLKSAQLEIAAAAPPSRDNGSRRSKRTVIPLHCRCYRERI